MKKEYILTFSISFLVIVTVFVILLMLVLPQQVQVLEGNTNKYEAITKSNYTYESTKEISEDTLKKQYTITAEDMSRFKSTSQYKAGNSDPFSPNATDVTTSGNTTSNKNTSGATSTQDKITNSNGGVKNPPSTNK